MFANDSDPRSSWRLQTSCSSRKFGRQERSLTKDLPAAFTCLQAILELSFVREMIERGDVVESAYDLPYLGT
jgi:hypothetical protein